MENEKQIDRLRLAYARINRLTAQGVPYTITLDNVSIGLGIPIDDTNEHITYHENQEFLTTKEEE